MKLFAAMPYKKRDGLLNEGAEKSVSIDFDRVWEKLFKPAIPSYFNEIKRADELRRQGVIDKLYIEELYKADIVLADLTFRNPNVFYEVGIRQALSRKGTILVACEGSVHPFDLRNQTVLHYDYFDATTTQSFQAELKSSIEEAAAQEVDSPIHVFLSGQLFVTRSNPEKLIVELSQENERLESALKVSRLQGDAGEFLQEVRETSDGAQILFLFYESARWRDLSVYGLRTLAIRLRKFGKLAEALEVLERACKIGPESASILREMGFVYRKEGVLDEAEKYMTRALVLNEKDPELQGMIGGLLKRRGEYQAALSHYQKAYKLDGESLYALVNLGAVSAALGDAPEAHKWYATVLSKCLGLIKSGKADYWTDLCLGEAAVAQNDEATAVEAFERAKEKAPIEDFRSATEQLEFLAANGFAADLAQKMLATFRP